MLFLLVVCIILLLFCDFVKGGGIIVDVFGIYCLLFGVEFDRGFLISWMKLLGGLVR